MMQEIIHKVYSTYDGGALKREVNFGDRMMY